jgi:hypothetical protein
VTASRTSLSSMSDAICIFDGEPLLMSTPACQPLHTPAPSRGNEPLEIISWPRSLIASSAAGFWPSLSCRARSFGSASGSRGISEAKEGVDRWSCLVLSRTTGDRRAASRPEERTERATDMLASCLRGMRGVWLW